MRTIRWFLVVSGLVVGGLLLGAPPKASGQIARRRVIVVDPFFHHYYPWGYPYGYSPYAYTPYNYSEVKIDTHRKDLSVCNDGGYAADVAQDKKFTLRPGTHDIELRSSDGQVVYQEQVAVTVGKTTKLQVS